jgi:probable HAF family extracellular repeat protein
MLIIAIQGGRAVRPLKALAVLANFRFGGGSTQRCAITASAMTLAFGLFQFVTGAVIVLAALGVDCPARSQTTGFLYSNGTYTTLRDPLAVGPTTSAYGINDAGQVVGTYFDATSGHGFIYSNGTYATFDFPGAFDTVLNGINDAGQIAGDWVQRSSHPL